MLVTAYFQAELCLVNECKKVLLVNFSGAVLQGLQLLQFCPGLTPLQFSAKVADCSLQMLQPRITDLSVTKHVSTTG